MSVSRNEWLFPKLASTRWPNASCTCCYDPLSDGLTTDQIYRKRHTGFASAASGTTYENVLPWDIRFQIKKLIIGDQISTYTRSSNENNPLINGPVGHTKHHKLPRQYQRALNSARKTEIDRSNSGHRSEYGIGSVAVLRKRTETASVERFRFDEKCERCGEDRLKMVAYHIRRDQPNIKLDAELITLSPKLRRPVTSSSTILKNRNIQPTGTVTLQRPTLCQSRTIQNIHGFRQSLRDLQPTDQRKMYTFPSQSCHSLFASQPNLSMTSNTFLCERLFTRLINPELALIECKALHAVADHSGLEQCVARALYSPTSPLRHALTGFHHLRLELDVRRSSNVSSMVPMDGKEQRTHERMFLAHETCHSKLKTMIGLLIYCKIDLFVHSLTSFGDLVDAVSQECLSRANSTTRVKSDSTHRGDSTGLKREYSDVHLDRCVDRNQELVLCGLDPDLLFDGGSSGGEEHRM